MSFKSSSLFQVLNRDIIQQFTLAYKKTFCFNIIINKIIKKYLIQGRYVYVLNLSKK